MSLRDKTAPTTSQAPKPRWKRILDLPAGTVVKDLSTGHRYRVDDFQPLYRDELSQVVETFRVKGTPETVHVPFIRLESDGFHCSLMAKG